MAAHDSILGACIKQTCDANKKQRLAPFKVEDLVYISTQNITFPKGLAWKLIPKYIGPYRITKDFQNQSFRIELPSYLKQRGLHDVFHAALLRIHVPNDNRLFPGHLVTQLDPEDSPEKEWAVNQILSHSGTKDNALFEVLWKAGDVTWLPYSEISHLNALTEYLDLMGVDSISFPELDQSNLLNQDLTQHLSLDQQTKAKLTDQPLSLPNNPTLLPPMRPRTPLPPPLPQQPRMTPVLLILTMVSKPSPNSSLLGDQQLYLPNKESSLDTPPIVNMPTLPATSVALSVALSTAQSRTEASIASIQTIVPRLSGNNICNPPYLRRFSTFTILLFDMWNLRYREYHNGQILIFITVDAKMREGTWNRMSLPDGYKMFALEWNMGSTTVKFLYFDFDRNEMTIEGTPPTPTYFGINIDTCCANFPDSTLKPCKVRETPPRLRDDPGPSRSECQDRPRPHYVDPNKAVTRKRPIERPTTSQKRKPSTSFPNMPPSHISKHPCTIQYPEDEYLA